MKITQPKTDYAALLSTAADAVAVGGIVVTGTPTVGEVLTATSATTADWEASAGTLTVKDEGTPLATVATSMDFVGAGVVASGATAAKTVTISGAPTGSAGGDLSGTYPNPSVVDDSHLHTYATAGGSEILISDSPSTPLIFADLLQNEAQTDLIYSG